MTSVAPAIEEASPERKLEPDSPPSTRQLARSLPFVTMIGVVVLGTILPILRNPNFYYWDDTAGVAIGVWQRIAQDLLSGQTPFIQLDMWRGGNLIAEAATGMWNPVMVGLMLGIYPIDDLAVAVSVAKIALFIIGASGVYMLARNYRARPWMAALAGTVLPLSGWNLFMDGTSWINGTAITAFTPWAWWAIRRCYQKRGTPSSVVVAVIAGYLLTSVGNPYGMISLAAAFMAVAVEAIASKRVREIWWLVGLGAAIVLMSVVVYLPFVQTSSVGFRANSTTFNDEFMSPNLSNLLGLSAPSFKPFVRMFGLPFMTFPGLYLAWFFLPMLPWLRWKAPGAHWRALMGVVAFGAFYLVVLLGPAQISMFRWPARLIPFFYLALMLVFVVVASYGLHNSRKRLRAGLSLLAVGAGAWMAFSDMPGLWKWHGLTTVVILALGFVFLRFGDVEGRGYAILTSGMVLFLGAQLMIAPGNGNVADYDLPQSRAEIIQRFSDNEPGLLVQVADLANIPLELDEKEKWADLLIGNMYSIAGVESTTAYSGIGFTKVDNALCMNYNGSTCPLAWESLWTVPPGATVRLADLLRAQTVVVLREYVRGEPSPEGWTRSDQSALVNVYTRDEVLPFPDGRLSYVGSSVEVASDEVIGEADERLVLSSESGGNRTISFARLAWPGYSATVDGKSVDVATGPGGLVSIEVPPGLVDAELRLTFAPPGLALGLGCMLVGLVGAGALIVTRRRIQANLPA